MASDIKQIMAQMLGDAEVVTVLDAAYDGLDGFDIHSGDIEN